MFFVILLFMSSSRGTAFISGHADGSIVRYTITEGITTEQQVSNVIQSVYTNTLCAIYFYTVRGIYVY